MADNYDFSGVWRSTYHKATIDDAPETDQYVTMQLIGDQLIVESIPSRSGSYLLARLTLDGRIATGSYQSQNSPHSAAKDALYYGAAQLVLDSDGKALRGKGVGFGKDLKVKTTVWELIRVGQDNEEAKKSKQAE
ncbi:MAG: hypothetical protein AAB834_03180 [Patescibacteria group bacterium]